MHMTEYYITTQPQILLVLICISQMYASLLSPIKRPLGKRGKHWPVGCEVADEYARLIGKSLRVFVTHVFHRLLPEPSLSIHCHPPSVELRRSTVWVTCSPFSAAVAPTLELWCILFVSIIASVPFNIPLLFLRSPTAACCFAC